MASSCNLKCFQNVRLWLLALVSTAMWAFSTADIQINGEIGGNVTFSCPYDKQKTLKFLYLQRDTKFVNGFYTGKDISEKWENTRWDHEEKAVHMFGLNISHSGTYECIFRYNDETRVTTNIHLSVTANYSKPTITTHCVDDFGCLVTCASHGGYPETKMMVNVNRNSSSQMWKVVNSSAPVRNPATMMFNSSSTAYFNCSYGQLDFVSCSVGEITSDMFSVCIQEDNPTSPINYIYIILAVVVVGLLVAITSIKMLPKLCRSRQTGAEDHVNTRAEEVTSLCEITVKEAA